MRRRYMPQVKRQLLGLFNAAQRTRGGIAFGGFFHFFIFLVLFFKFFCCIGSDTVAAAPREEAAVPLERTTMAS